MDNLKQTKKDKLLTWMLHQQIFRTSDVITWGIAEYHTRADRDKRDFVSQGLIIALSDAEKEELNFKTVEGIYVTPQRYLMYFPEKSQMELSLK